MFHDASIRLVDWINQIAHEPIAALGLGASAGSGRRIGLSLVDVRPQASRPGARVDVTLRYLVTVSADVPTEAHRLLGELTFAAMTHRDFQVDREPLPLEFWLAHDLAPQPSLVVSLTVSRDRRDTDNQSAPRLLMRDRQDTEVSRPFERRSSPAPCGFRRRASDLRQDAVAGLAIRA
jgi:hypothetical protein